MLATPRTAVAPMRQPAAAPMRRLAAAAVATVATAAEPPAPSIEKWAKMLGLGPELEAGSLLMSYTSVRFRVGLLAY